MNFKCSRTAFFLFFAIILSLTKIWASEPSFDFNKGTFEKIPLRNISESQIKKILGEPDQIFSKKESPQADPYKVESGKSLQYNQKGLRFDFKNDNSLARITIYYGKFKGIEPFKGQSLPYSFSKNTNFVQAEKVLAKYYTSKPRKEVGANRIFMYVKMGEIRRCLQFHIKSKKLMMEVITF